MLLVEVLTIAEQALKTVFVPGYTTLDGQTDFSNLHISIEYPILEQNYPGIWVDFDIDGQLTRAGIDNIQGYNANPDGTFTPYYLWRAQGWISYTIVALTSLQRARLHDELVRIIAFNGDPQVNPYRAFVEDSPLLIAMNVNFDNIAERSAAATPGTPWGTNEIVYEMTIAVQAVVEFQATNANNKLIPFNNVGVIGTDPDGYELQYTNIEGVENIAEGFDLPGLP